MKIETQCPTCRDSARTGMLWLSGSDYLECPDCNGTGTFVMYEQRIMPGKSILVPGLKPLIKGNV